MSHSLTIDEEWNKFILGKSSLVPPKHNLNPNVPLPKSTPIYISTKTMITYLNQPIDINYIFWNMPITKYYKPLDGIIKKQIKMTSLNKEKDDEIKVKLDTEHIYNAHTISFVENNKNTYKHVQKINIGISKKDILRYRCKQKGAFYNCCAIIFRILYKNTFKEVHIKIFNTGKLEIPGIQDDNLLFLTLDKLVSILQLYIPKPLSYNKDTIDTVLINSNFNCGYFINRNILHSKLKLQYNLISMFDPCSYPGIQSKFYYNTIKETQDGICNCEKKCSKGGSGTGMNQCVEVSFMIFRTGSVLIVGHCDEYILKQIYKYLVNIFKQEFQTINEGIVDINAIKKKSKPKQKKKSIIIDLV